MKVVFFFSGIAPEGSSCRQSFRSLPRFGTYDTQRAARTRRHRADTRAPSDERTSRTAWCVTVETRPSPDPSSPARVPSPIPVTLACRARRTRDVPLADTARRALARLLPPPITRTGSPQPPATLQEIQGRGTRPRRRSFPDASGTRRRSRAARARRPVLKSCEAPTRAPCETFFHLTSSLTRASPNASRVFPGPHLDSWPR